MASDYAAVLKYATKLGADETEAYSLERRKLTVRMANNQIVETKGMSERGLGLRVVKNKAIGFVATNELSEDSLRRTAEAALTNAKIRGPSSHWTGFPTSKRINRVSKLYDKNISEMRTEEAVELALRMLTAAERFDPRIVDVSGSLNIFFDSIGITNSHGLDLSEDTTTILGSITTEAEQDSTRSSGIGFDGTRWLTDFAPEGVGEESATMAARSLGAKKIDAGSYSLIFEPFALAEMLSYIFIPSIVSKAYQDNVSCLRGKRGKKVAQKGVSINDDATLPGYPGARSFDDEGVPKRKLPIIEHGVLRNLLYDTFHASRDGVASSGNAVRDSYRVAPVPGAQTLVIEKGEQSKEELIRSTKSGILVGRVWYTFLQNLERGDFSTTTRSGTFLVKDYEIREPIQPMRIIDNLPRCLLNLDGIANDAKLVTRWDSPGHYVYSPTVRFEGVNATPI